MFRADPLRRVFAITGCVTEAAGVRKRRRNVTFVARSSALIDLALSERRGTTIEWEKWKGELTAVEPPSRVSSVRVEGSRVFVLGEQGSLSGEARFTIYNFSPGARKGQRDLPYTKQDFMITATQSVLEPHKSWEVSGDSLILLDVRDLKFCISLSRDQIDCRDMPDM